MSEKITDLSQVKLGKTRVIVKKKNEEGGKERVTTIKEGYALQKTSNFLRVFDPRKNSGDVGDGSGSELFPINGETCWCEISSPELEDSLVIPLVFRN